MGLAAAAPEINRCSAQADADQPASGQAKLSSCPSGSVMWKKRSPHGASQGALSGCTPAATSLSWRASTSAW